MLILNRLLYHALLYKLIHPPLVPTENLRLPWLTDLHILHILFVVRFKLANGFEELVDPNATSESVMNVSTPSITIEVVSAGLTPLYLRKYSPPG
jgi:hypothetical protein